jgi:hypothetical protein
MNCASKELFLLAYTEFAIGLVSVVQRFQDKHYVQKSVAKFVKGLLTVYMQCSTMLGLLSTPIKCCSTNSAAASTVHAISTSSRLSGSTSGPSP